MIGEIGGSAEERGRRVPDAQQGQEAGGGLHRRSHRPARPPHGPCRRDHLAAARATPASKMEAMRSAGIAVADSPAALGSTMLKVLKG